MDLHGVRETGVLGGCRHQGLGLELPWLALTPCAPSHLSTQPKAGPRALGRMDFLQQESESQSTGAGLISGPLFRQET